MSAAVRVDVLRSPEQFADDLAELTRLDWPAVWAGWGSALPDRWCARLGWRVVNLDSEGNLRVHMASGGSLEIIRGLAQGAGVIELSEDLLQAAAATKDSNDETVSATDNAWPAYLASAEQLLGPPTLLTTWAGSDFPQGDRWPDLQTRREERHPYRLAVWLSEHPDGPTTELWINVGYGTVPRIGPGGSSVILAARRSAHVNGASSP